MQKKTYDVLKYIALIVLPALGTLYFALSKIWGLPYGTEIVGTLSAFDAFIGALLQVSKAEYDMGINLAKSYELQAEKSATQAAALGKFILEAARTNSIVIDGVQVIKNDEAYEVYDADDVEG